MKLPKPLAIDLFSGLGGWTDGLLANGWNVIGFDIERHDYGTGGYPAQLVLQDVLTLHGSQFRDAALIVASPPCQEYSYMAMPWSRAKKIAAEYRSGERDVKQLTALFDACFRIQREACEAAGRYIPMIVENVRGAQKWVGRSRWHYGSFHLWGDVPALMPMMGWDKFGTPGYVAQGFNVMAAQQYRDGIKLPGNNGPRRWAHREVQRLADGNTHAMHRRQAGIKGSEDQLGGGGLTKFGSKSNSRKAASAQIAKIPLPLSDYIARHFLEQLCD